MRYKVTLTQEEISELSSIAKKGKHNSSKVVNALILLCCDEGKFNKDRFTTEIISKVLKVSPRKIERLKKKFVEEGFDSVLDRRPTSRRYNKKVDGDLEAQIIAVCCSEPPKGFGQWSLRLLADKIVELEYVDCISHETIRKVLKKRNKTLEKRKLGNSP